MLVDRGCVGVGRPRFVRALRECPETDLHKGVPDGLEAIRVNVRLEARRRSKGVVVLEEPEEDTDLVNGHGAAATYPPDERLGLPLPRCTRAVLEAAEEPRHLTCCGTGLV